MAETIRGKKWRHLEKNQSLRTMWATCGPGEKKINGHGARAPER